MSNNKFEYTYSAKEQDEIKKIREKYIKKNDDSTDKMEQLRRLDEGVTKKASSAALAAGIVGAIVMGTGMSFIMTDIVSSLGNAVAVLLGIIIGAAGMVGVITAYPLYNRIIKKERKKIAPEIIRLTDELMK